ncbi:MAG: FHA domain-containing protein, partial [Deltaproteobacteria bacterium]|nr:FHA domain-containing protein [Deltaproteobacteria bacterium]
MNKRRPSQQPGHRPTRQPAPGNGRGVRSELRADLEEDSAWAHHSRSSRLPRTVVPDDEGNGDDIDIAPHGVERAVRSSRHASPSAAPRRSAAPAAARPRSAGASGLAVAVENDGQSPVGVLTCVSGPEEGLGLTLTEGVFGIGRGRDNHFVLKDIAASRQHVEVRVHRGEVVVVDLGSGNGTRINGKRIQQATLKPGDRIEIGNSALTFTPLGGARQTRREVSVVPPRPAPKPKDLWPETETLLSELKEFEARAQPRGHQPRGIELPASQRHPVQPAMRAYGSSALDESAGLEDLAGLGQPPRFGSAGWLLAGAGLIVVLLGLAALIFYLTQVKNSQADQARQFALQGMQALLEDDVDNARRAFQEALTRQPDNPEAKQGLE